MEKFPLLFAQKRSVFISGTRKQQEQIIHLLFSAKNVENHSAYIAQLVEHLTCNQAVGSSTLSVSKRWVYDVFGSVEEP